MKFTISAVILAGGKARRMHGADKGLLPFPQHPQCSAHGGNDCAKTVEPAGRPLFQHVLSRLRPQIADISINANRNRRIYAQSGLPVFGDELPDFQGPLSGMLTALKRAKTDFVLFVPCDCPLLPLNLAQKLKSAVGFGKISAAYAFDGERDQPTFCLLSVKLIPALQDYLNRGERRILGFMRENHAVKADFSGQKDAFRNFNTLAELENA